LPRMVSTCCFRLRCIGVVESDTIDAYNLPSSVLYCDMGVLIQVLGKLLMLSSRGRVLVL